MALEPKVVTAEASPSAGAELADMQRRLVASVALTVPLFVVAMADMVPGDPVGHAVEIARLPWTELGLAAPGPGDRVTGGTLNGDGALVIRAEQVDPTRCSRRSSRWCPTPPAREHPCRSSSTE